MKKMYFLDLDGTLLRNDGTYNENMKEVIKEFRNKNSHIILTSARSRYKMKKICQDLEINSYFISSNGAEIYDAKNDKILFSSFLSKKSMEYIYFLAKKYKIELVLAINETEYILNDDLNDIRPRINEKDLNEYNVKQCMMLSKDTKKLNKFLQRLNILDDIDFVYNLNNIENGKYWYSVVNKNISKGSACLILSKYCNVNIDDTVGIGNDYNDISMFNIIGLSISVSNAIREIKDQTKLVIDSNNNDGVYKYLKDVLNE